VSFRFLHIIFRYVDAAEKHSYYGLQINPLKNSPGLAFSVLQPLNDHHTSYTLQPREEKMHSRSFVLTRESIFIAM
jgi:hypothetical protein